MDILEKLPFDLQKIICEMFFKERHQRRFIYCLMEIDNMQLCSVCISDWYLFDQNKVFIEQYSKICDNVICKDCVLNKSYTFRI